MTRHDGAAGAGAGVGTTADGSGGGGVRPLPMDESILFKLVRVLNLTARPFAESIGRDNRLSLNEWRVMLVLASHPGAAAQEVALHTGLDKMTVSRALAALARQGRLVRKEDAADKRRTTIRLSAAGQRVFERIAASGRQREAQLFAAIDVADRDRLSKTLDGLVEALLALEAAKPA